MSSDRDPQIASARRAVLRRVALVLWYLLLLFLIFLLHDFPNREFRYWNL